MSQKVILYRILIASPSDCSKERKLLPEIIYSWNASNTISTSAILEPVLWETHSKPEFGDRPQGLLNKQLVTNCDILVGAFWTRLGTHTGKAASGTAEEIDEFRKTGKPVLLYFSSLPAVPDTIDKDQLDALRKYKTTIEDEGIIFNYESLDELKTLFTRHLSSTMNTIHKSSNADFDFEEENKKTQQIRLLSEFKDGFSSLVREFTNKWELEKETYPETYDLTESEYILDSIITELLNYKSQIVSTKGTDLEENIYNILKELRLLRNQTKHLDSAFSSRNYFLKGDQIIKMLLDVVEQLNEIIRELSEEDV